MLNVEYTNQFKRDLKLSKRRHKNLSNLQAIMQTIQLEKKINTVIITNTHDHIIYPRLSLGNYYYA